MDNSIRTLLAAAQQITVPDQNKALQKAYEILRNVAENKPTVDAPEAFGQDLYVLCAEIAFQNGLPDMARECLKMFFMKPPPGNQFLCRAYLCQAQLLAPQEANNPDQLEKAVVYLLKAISFAKKNTRYHFLVYNASVIYWQFCRPFLKPNYRQYLARSLHQVVKALDDIDDKDYEWRAQLMIALMECHLDAGRKNDAANIAGPASSFIKQNVPTLYKQVFGLIVRNQLLESSKLHKDVKNSAELAIYYKILKLKVSYDASETREYYSEIQRILNQIGVVQGVASDDRASLKVDKSRGRKGTGSSPTPASGKLEDGERSLASSPDSTEFTPEPLTRKGSQTRLRSPSKAGRRTPTPTSTKKLSSDSPDKPYLLLELGRFCMELDFSDLAQDCVDHMKSCVVKDPGFYLGMELLECELMVKSYGNKQESYQRNIIDVRLQAIKRCEEAIMNTIRQGDPNVIQAACVTQWNMCLPLLQPNLRHYVRKPLTLVAEALEDIQSLLISLRCQVHTELAKCEEDQEQIQVAMEHLRKALSLDDGNVYCERLEVALHRLELRSQLYKQPERPEDIAAMIIEQARKADSGTMRMKRSLLVKAGEALAPDAFLLVLDSESDTKENEETDVTGGKAPLTQIRKLANKARQFNKCVKKAGGHLKRLGDENDRERARLWGDLAKTARKQEVWDVCRVASRFCLLYDDGRWKNVIPEKKMESPKPEKRREGAVASSMGASAGGIQESSMKMVQESSMGMAKESAMSAVPEGSLGEMDKKNTLNRQMSRPSSPERGVPLYDKDLIRMLAEVSFIQGEAVVHLLRSENVQLNDMPIPPVDKSKRPKGYVAKKPEEDPDWIEYCDWIKALSVDATSSFLRGLELGVELVEPWLVCSAAAYVWNYNNHVLTQLRHREIMDTLTTIVNGLRKVGHAGETVMLVNICGALAYAYMKPWIPQEPDKEMQEPGTPVASPDPKKGKGAPAAAKSKPQIPVSISADAMPDLKKAVEVIEYAMEVTGGSNSLHIVPISVRMPLLQIWVAAKQMAQTQIPKTLGADDEPYADPLRQMSRAVVAVEMLHLSKNGIMEFKDMPSMADVANWMEECTWADKFMELQLWTRLTSLAFAAHQHPLVVRCSKKALRFAVVGTQPRNRKMDAHRYIVEQEMLSYASGILGQSLIENMAGKNAIRREGMEAFLNSARYARNAENYELVMTAARHYWNACLPLVNQPIERELLREPIKAILHSITATAEKVKKPEEKQESDDDEQEDGVAEVTVEEKTPTIGSPDDDLTLRASLYGVLFQSYTDKKQWEEGLEAMDQAITDMPRTNHRLLIFKHRVMTKAKLGRSVNMDIQKFKDEREDYVAHMWRRVALSSKETLEQLISYQAAIESLTSASNEWLKVDLLMEFGQWLYYNEFPLQDAIDQVEWSVDIIFNMKTEAELLREQAASVAKKGDKKGKGKSSAKKTGPPPAPQAQPAPVQASTPLPTSKSESTLRKTPEPKKAKSVKSADSRSDTSSVESEINAEGYIPVAKPAVIGVLPNNPGLKIQDLEDIRQIEGLIRTQILLADMAGRSSMDYKDHLLMAYSFIIRMWQISVPVSGPVIKEMAKNQAANADAKADNMSAKKGKGKDDKKDAPPVKEKPKRKGPLDWLPTTTEEWATYDAPDEVLEAFNHDTMKASGINSNTISKPMLTFHYLDMLTQMLRDVGYNHLALPVLALQDILSRDLLQSETLNTLVHARAMEICQELNLKQGVSFHEKITGALLISEEDQAQSRDDIALWKEKQIQVAREEMRVKESLAKLAEESRQSKSYIKSLSRPGVSVDTKTEEPIDSHLGKVLGAVTYRDVWTDTAELLIRQCNYQNAREFLNEAHIAATAFEDKTLQARILFHLGQLAMQEAQYGQAFNFCREAQMVHSGDEVFWFKTTMLMIETTLQDYENRNAKRVARGILVHALNEFSRIADERPNRDAVLQYMVAAMEAKLASVQSSIIFDEHMDINEPKVMKRVLAICERFETATDKMVKLGYCREVLPVMKDHSDVLVNMAKHSIEKEIIHTYFLQALMVLKEAVSIAEDVYNDVQTLRSLQEIRNLSLPIQRELADIKVHCGEVMIQIFHVHSRETRDNQLEDIRKGSVVKMVEDYIRATPNYTHMEKEWSQATKTVAEDALLKFVDAHNLAAGIPQLRAKALCGIGQCLKAFSTFSSPDSPTQWLVHEMELSKFASDPLGEGEENGEGKTEIDETSKQYVRYSKQIKEMKDAEEVSCHYLLQATEVLTQALNLSLHNKYTDIASAVSLELVECCGQYDSQSTSQFLALFQSCNTSQILENLLYKAQMDPMSSRLASLLHQRKTILSTDIQTNMSASSVMSSVQSSLEQNWQAWKKLEVQTQHLDLLKEFPPNFNFIVLQHTPDKQFLYGAILDKPKSSAAAAAKTKQQAPPSPSRSKVFGVETSPEILDELLEKFSDHRHGVQQLLLKQEYQRAQAMMRQKMLENLDESLKHKTQSFHLDEDAEEEAKLTEEFRQLLKDMESYLQPITAYLAGTLNPHTVTPASGKEGKNAPTEPAPSIETVVLLVDPFLAQLPLEALEFLQVENVVSVCRDFSLQMFYHRFYREEATEEVGGDKKKKAKGGSVDNPTSRIPGLRDISKKQAKIIPVTREIQPWQIAVDTMNFRYIVDSHLDCAETEVNKPIDVMNSIIEEYEQQYTPRWLGIMGNEHAPSVGEWEIYLTENSSFIFYGMEKFLNYIPPAKVTALNIPDCSIVYLQDLAQTSKSFTRQSKLDVLKSATILSLEKPVETALLISLTGVKCLMANQWNCTLAENADRLKFSMKDMLEDGKTTGEATRILYTPYRRKKPQPDAPEGDPEGESQVGGSQREEQSSRRSFSEEEEELPESEMSWFNMVCYGLPNLVITQL